LTKFSSKTRHNLTRSVHKFQELSGGRIQWRVFATAGEIETFYSVAIHISKKTYKGAIGRGFSEKPAFRKRLIEAAERGSVRGYVLYCADDPVAYAFCRVESSALVYEHIGYDPAYSRSSPGTVLLYLMIERLFEEKNFSHLDLMEGSYWHYKAMFATERIPSAIVLNFPLGARNLAIVTGHYAVRRLESALVRVKHALGAFRKGAPAG
jgi:CelD/BcsL family acetyltransferase involved in cellulose biosynthesis